jgi:crotonobetainyl-CoA:carnitine CoA-transferase CaiB-like acyl-CoA transferase
VIGNYPLAVRGPQTLGREKVLHRERDPAKRTQEFSALHLLVSCDRRAASVVGVDSDERIDRLVQILGQAGPYCTYQLALLGAEVIKVEPLRGDMVRGWGGSDEQLALGLGSGFVAQNSAKRSLAVDLTTSEGAATVSRLAAEVDIVVENYRPNTMEGFGLGHEAVTAINPAVIYCSSSAFGQSGP